MAGLTQFGRPKSVVITPKVGTAITITDISELECDFSPELIEHFGGVDRFPLYTIGNDNTTITVKTTDTAALAILKGMECTSVVAAFQLVFPTSGITAGSNPYTTPPSGTIGVGMTINYCICTDGAKMSNGADGKPGEITLKFRPGWLSDAAAEPTIVIDANTSA